MREKHLKFVELAEKRTNNTIKCMHLIGNLFDKRNYEYTDEQAVKILSALEDELKALKAKLKTASKTTNRFKL
jgi:hypothetical protein